MPTGRNVDALQIEKAIQIVEYEHVDVALVERLDRLVVPCESPIVSSPDSVCETIT